MLGPRFDTGLRDAKFVRFALHLRPQAFEQGPANDAGPEDGESDKPSAIRRSGSALVGVDARIVGLEDGEDAPGRNPMLLVHAIAPQAEMSELPSLRAVTAGRLLPLRSQGIGADSRF